MKHRQLCLRFGRARAGARTLRVTMLLENNPYPQDTRVRNEATSLCRAGCEVRVIAPRHPAQPALEVVDGVVVERFWLPTGHRGGVRGLLLEYLVAHVQLYARAARALLRGTDVIHAHNPPDTLFLPALFGRAFGCRFVFDQHDLFPDLIEAKFRRPLLVGVARLAQRMSLRTVAVVITTNLSQKASASEARHAEGASVVLVRNGVLG